MASKKISEIATTSYFANTDIIPLVRTVSSTKTTYVATISALFGSVDADAHFHGAFSANNGGVFSGNTFHANTDSVQLDGNTTIQHLEIANSYFGLANTYTPANSTFVPHSTGVWMFMDDDAIYVAHTGTIRKAFLYDFSEATPSFSLPVANSTVLGGVMQGDNITIDANGVISAATAYTLPVANSTVLGGVIAGTNISIAANGAISVTGLGTAAALNTTDVLRLAVADQALSGGVIVTAHDYGTVSSGTVTVNPGHSPSAYLTNNGAFTLAAPSNEGSQDIMVTNGASAGSITFSGFTKALVGDSLTTTVNHKFLISIGRINGVSFYQIVAMQ